MRWWIIQIDLMARQIVSKQNEGVRPADARPCELLPDGSQDPWTPWYAGAEHIHTDDSGCVEGAHVRAASFVEAVEKALAMCFGKPQEGRSQCQDLSQR
jgi:hypothetical protein